MKRVVTTLAALAGAGLVVASVIVLFRGTEAPAEPARSSIVVPSARGAAELAAEADSEPDGGARVVLVRDAMLVVNQDGSATVAALVQNATRAEIALTGVSVVVKGELLAVNSTEMWLPVPAGQRGQVGAASDAGGFVVPAGVTPAARADVEFRFDDGTCVMSKVSAVARGAEHRSIYPKNGRPIGPVTSADLPAADADAVGACRTAA